MSATLGARAPPFDSPAPLHNASVQQDLDERFRQGQSPAGVSRALSSASSNYNTSAQHQAPSGYFPIYPDDQQQLQQQYQDPVDHTQQAQLQHQQDLSYQEQDPALLNTKADNAVAGLSPYDSVTSPSHRAPKFTEEWDASRRGSSIVDGHMPHASSTMQRSNSYAGSSVADRPESQQLSRGNTLKKKASLKRGGSLKRSSSRRSMKAGSVRSLALQSNGPTEDQESPFWCPVATHGNPTEVLANRFQAWRKILKDLITYFREIQNHYEHRSKSLIKLGNVLNNTSMPPGFLPSGGLDDAIDILKGHNKKAIEEANRAREIEEDVILALIGLRSDLQQKIKEIKNLAGDFKNTVDKETEATRKAVKQLNEVLGQAEADPSLTTGKQDPYLLRLAVDRQIERQIEEENYLHRAYLNIERSGRDLESIVVGEVQKAYNAYAGILKREAETAQDAVGELRAGPISMPKDNEWEHFVSKDERFVNPNMPLRSPERIHYRGQDALACQEIRAGLLERKSKYVLSPTHLHEFKSADKTQAPVMSLFLPEQKLGSHSTEGASSNKFIIKGRQTGSMHRGHTWVFRAESHDTMMAWYMDIKLLTESSPEEQSNFVRKHSRSYSRSSQHSASSDGMVDEDDDEPFAPDSAAISRGTPSQDVLPRRPSPGGRFPSDLTINAERGLQVPQSPASVNSGVFQVGNREGDGYGYLAANGGSGSLSRSGSQRNGHRFPAPVATDMGQYNDRDLGYGSTARSPMNQVPSNAARVAQEAREDGVNPYTSEPISQYDNGYADHANGQTYGMVQSDATEIPRRSSKREARGFSTDDHDGTFSQPVAENSGVAVPTHLSQSTAAGVSSDRTSSELDGESAISRGRSPAPGVTATGNGHAGLGDDTNGRPVSGTMRTDSQPTISNLHIPGEYPKTPKTMFPFR
ncbi:hypothetical protein PoMZ_07512 [Pyricularia oryzae]|uniref:PH domain-containing protein n=1 Tax=Pyricularia oryzae TaxID=318829 RepID=A0A4P7NFA9_PYROR|nr:hypothetical protein PoMZ_07512 [Pyricularia oryzae]